jgi:phosphoglycolate phosphatase
MRPHLKAVLFDLDGTLIDSAPGLGIAADLMRTKRGLASLPLSRYRPMAGAGARGMLSVALDKTVHSPDYEALKEEFFQTYEACMLAHCELFGGVVEMIEGLTQRQLKWGIVTNKSARFTVPIVDSIASFSSAQAVVSGDTTAYSKPHPEPLFEAARRLGVLPNECIYVGDDKRDIDAARAAGMLSYAATWGYLGEHAVETWQADVCLNTPLELLTFCEKFGQ